MVRVDRYIVEPGAVEMIPLPGNALAKYTGDGI